MNVFINSNKVPKGLRHFMGMKEESSKTFLIEMQINATTPL